MCPARIRDLIMKTKLFIFALAALGMLACTPRNNPNNPDNPIAKKGALPGKFTINAKGDQVQFSQGNLQYQASTNTWRFAEHQYDYVGAEGYGNVYENDIKSDNTKISNSYNGWIDLFGWGTGKNPTLLSTNANDYQTFADWGINAISNGGNSVNCWRTLSIDEWLWITRKRPNAQNLCGQATVVGIHGMIILPDDWKTPSNITWQGVPDNWTANQYNASEWSSMEKVGAVFLPAEGYLRGHIVGTSGIGSFCAYWSSTEDELSIGWVDYFCCDETIIAEGYEVKDAALSVRLVNQPPQKEREETEGGGNSQRYMDGSSPEIDYNASIVNGKEYDNGLEKCWKATMTTTVAGFSSSSEDYYWGTEFGLVVAWEETMYALAQSGISASYVYVDATQFKDHDSCLASNDD